MYHENSTLNLYLDTLMKIAFDLDNTICEGVPIFETPFAVPHPKVLLTMELLHDNGHEIIVYTARPWNQYNMTKEWLDRHEVTYDLLVCGKFPYDTMLCDRSTNKLSELLNGVMENAKKKSRDRNSVQG